MGGMGTPRTTRSSRLLKVLADFEQVFVVAHNHPDPDAVASGWAVSWMIREKLGKPVRLIGGGDILRAENRHMIKLLEPPIELVREPPEIGQAAVVLVDCAAGQQNHLLAANDLQPTAVIDHHPPHGPSPRLAFRDKAGYPDWFVGIDQIHIPGTPIPMPLVIFLLFAVVMGLVLHKTTLGRWIYTIGTNEQAAYYSGIAVDRIKVIIFTVTGFLSGLAGIIMVSRLGVSRYDHARGWELDVITAVVLGGTDIAGGRGSILGSVIAFLLIVILRTGMGVANVKDESQMTVIGALLIIAIITSSLLKRFRKQT